MKTRALAYNLNTGRAEYITAYDAVYLREFVNKEYRNHRFFYVDEHSKERFEVVPKFRQKGKVAFFAFVPNATNVPNIRDEGESLTHYAAKKALANLQYLHLLDIRTRQEYFLKIIPEYSCNEKRFEFENVYYADVYYRLDRHQKQAEMRRYPYKWYENFVIEVCVTHKVSQEKAEFFRKNNIPVFEVLIPDTTRKKFSLDDGTKLSKEQIDTAVINMQKMFGKVIKGIMISDPSSEEYELMNRYKKEIDTFKCKKEKTEIEYSAVCSQLEEQSKILAEIKSEIDYYKSLEQTVNDLKAELDYCKKHPIKTFLKKSHRENS